MKEKEITRVRQLVSELNAVLENLPFDEDEVLKDLSLRLKEWPVARLQMEFAKIKQQMDVRLLSSAQVAQIITLMLKSYVKGKMDGRAEK